MLHLVENMQFKADIEFVSKDSPCFKPVEYPPKNDFVMSIDESGKVVSRYGDDTWDFKTFGLPWDMHFGYYDKTNKIAFKQIMFYLIYSHLFPGKYSSLNAWYLTFQYVFKVCTELGIEATQLSRYPKVVERIAESFAKNSPATFQQSIWHYSQILKNCEQIGFTVLNEKSIALYKRFDPDYEMGQNAYIPARIWTKFIQQLDYIFDDFDANQDNLKILYHYLASNQIANQKRGFPEPTPFDDRGEGKQKYNGSFNDYLKTHNLLSIFEKYTERAPSIDAFDTQNFKGLINNTMFSCYLYVLFYSIMRKKEALSLQEDCLIKETDERLGDFYLLVGETTKTDPDSDARWVVSKRVERAINIAKTLLNWKLKYVKVSQETPYLFQRIDVWNKEAQVSQVKTLQTLKRQFASSPKFFRLTQFEITQADYDEAIALTPSLTRKEWFQVGNIWQFSYHQLRRTLAVHFALNRVSISSTQQQMKHGTREQQFHYQNNAGRLRLNRLAEQEVVNEYYAEMARNISAVVHGEAILPHNKSPVKQEIIHFIEKGEKKKLLKAEKNGAVGYRKNILGGCMKQGTCEYGGFDSIAHCSGGHGGNVCSDLIIDGAREQEFLDDKNHCENQMDELPEDSPRYGALKAEVQGYEKVLEIIKQKKGGNKK